MPEEIGKQAAFMLLDEVSRGGVVDSGHQVRHSVEQRRRNFCIKN